MRVGLGGRAPLTGTPKVLYDMSRKALDMENLSPYSGFMRGTWREGSYTDDSEGHKTEGSGTGSLLLWGSIRGI